MSLIFSALIPVFALILIGYFFKRIKFPSHEFWPQADKLTYYVLMPSLLIYKLSNPNAFTSVIQGGIRFNTYVFLALSGAIFGNEGLILSAILLTFTIPFINILCITIFALYIGNDKLNFLYLLKSIVTNPLIVACVIGGGINFLGIQLPLVLNNTLEILSKAALPMGLLSVGFGLVIKEIKDSKTELFISSFAKHIILPFFIFILGKYFELNDLMLSILILFAILPTASSSFILARQLGGDIGLMSSIITVQTLVSALFIIIFLKIFV